MLLLKKLDKNRAIKNMELMLEVDDKKHKKIYVGDNFHRVYLKGFCGDFDYRKFMVEAVLLRLMADKKSVSRANKAYNTIYDSLQEIEHNQLSD